MRVIAGTAKGMRLASPRGEKTRPTLDRVREALFSILGERVEGARALDLFAGTGAVGIEALSRGASHCDFVESDGECVEVITKNLGATRFGARAKVWRSKLPGALKRLADAGVAYDFIFADPPYEFDDYAGLFCALEAGQFLTDDGVLVLEQGARKPRIADPEGFTLLRESRYGTNLLLFYSLEESGE